MADTLLLTELNRQHEAAPPTRDRLVTTLFLVGALHALVILGVTFTSAGTAGARDNPMLEVLIVHDPVVDPRTNESADYLAQVNQRGSGTDPAAQRAESPHTPPDDPGGAGSEPGPDGPDATAGASGLPDLLATRATSSDKLSFARAGGAMPAGAPLVFEPPAQEFAGLDTGEALRLKGHTERELMVSANTRESSVAVYLDAWRRKIENIASANYPWEAVRAAGHSGTPELEVVILANGTLAGAAITRSSGYPDLDRAALTILHLSAPFEPFPASLAARHDSLRLTYGWQFEGGAPAGSTVRAPADTR